jgi:sulfonate transport system substrate-binding protein
MIEDVMKLIARIITAAKRWGWGMATIVLAFPGSVAWAEQPKEVRIATVAHYNGSRPSFIGSAAVIEKQGWLREELKKRGIRLVWVPVAPQSVGATINESFANHSIDFAGYGDLPSIILNAGGVETRLIVPGGRGNNVYLLVPPNSPAKSITDLKGKRIALHRGRPWEITFARLAEANGLKLTDFRIANLNPGAGAAALAAGNVDAFVTLSDAFPLVDKKIGRILWSTKTPGQDWKMRAELWGDKAFIEKYPDITQIVANAYVRAAHWVAQEENYPEFIRIAVVGGQDAEVVKREYADDSISWKARWNPVFDEFVTSHYRNAIYYSRKVNLIRNAFDESRLFEPKFVRQALKDLKLEGYWDTPAVAASTDKRGSS